jgi:hypothetical protein
MENVNDTVYNMNAENNKNIINGWEYVTEIKPNNVVTEQKLQDNYLMQYNLAYHKFVKSLCIEKDMLDSIVKDTGNNSSKYKYIIDINEDNDIINKDDDYPIKFLKSKFISFKLKKLRTDLISYYKPLGFYVKGPYELTINKKINKYYIELCWNNNNNNGTISSQI